MSWIVNLFLAAVLLQNALSEGYNTLAEVQYSGPRHPWFSSAFGKSRSLHIQVFVVGSKSSIFPLINVTIIFLLL